MLVTHEADGISIDFGDMDEDEFCDALEHFEECLDGWQGDPRVLLAAIIRVIDEIIEDATKETVN
jgi:hypothetical protein